MAFNCYGKTMTSLDFVDAIELAKKRRNFEETAHTQAYREMLTAVRGFQNAVVQANPSLEQLEQMTSSLQQMQAMLEAQAVPEVERWYGRGGGRDGKLQLVTPQLIFEKVEDDRIQAHTVAGEFYIGMNGAMHGGIVATIFDAILGRMAAGTQGLVCRTAYLTTEYKAITPLNQRLDLVAKLESVERRKRFVTGQLWHGDTLCAKADALFVEMLPGQQ
jgi:acyl-coenzyme A thioesterase PaaI-like protein